MRRWGVYILAALLFIGGLICALSPHLAKDLATLHVMLTGQPDMRLGAEAIEPWLNWIGGFCAVLALILTALAFKRRKG